MTESKRTDILNLFCELILGTIELQNLWLIRLFCYVFVNYDVNNVIAYYPSATDVGITM